MKICNLAKVTSLFTQVLLTPTEQWRCWGQRRHTTGVRGQGANETAAACEQSPQGPPLCVPGAGSCSLLTGMPLHGWTGLFIH